MLLVAVSLLLCACAHDPSLRAPLPAALFADEAFGAPSEPVGAEHIFAMTPEMQRYARVEMAALVRRLGVQKALVQALYHDRQLKLEYDSSVTRTAAQAFEARSGNCLSLVLMTAAFAKEFGVPVRYQTADLEELWLRRGNLMVRSGHVNIVLGSRLIDGGRMQQDMIIDFLPADEIRGLKTREIPERTVVAMFMNNRAVEALAQDRLDDAYAWAKAAAVTDRAQLAPLNTLGVVYMRRGALDRAAIAFNEVLQADARHTRALSNLAEVRERQGLGDEARQLRMLLARLEPEPPLHYFNLGLAAVRRNDFASARELLAKEAARGDAAAAVHFWLGVVNYRLGDLSVAKRELQLAAEASASRGERDVYLAKLAALRQATEKLPR
jgi:tetratricopeptide (TPR) repeat protein